VTIDDRIQQGDFVGALGLIAPAITGPSPDPGQLLLAFNLEVRLQRFDAADQTIRRLMQIAPQVADAMAAFARNARAERTATQRMTDPAIAGKREGLGMPPPHALGYVKAALLHAMKDHAGAVAALAEVKPTVPATPGTMTWRAGRTARFANLSDSDELTGPILPVYDGETVLDLAYVELKSITFHDAKTSFDMMWIPTEIEPVRGNPIRVKVPAFHVGTGVAGMDMVRTGQMTSWDRTYGYALAIGQRDFELFNPEGGKSMVGILQVRRIEFDPPAAGAPADKPKGFWKKLFS
jgi:protein involved in temperature-dependent protein secretion